nr:hypothetical protein Iba_scaffold3049CG0820 [Ipomoea batatas]GME20230.1 hypothetical protein Iba_scaffold24603CG0020 [Ipomoea batatas]
MSDGGSASGEVASNGNDPERSIYALYRSAFYLALFCDRGWRPSGGTLAGCGCQRQRAAAEMTRPLGSRRW